MRFALLLATALACPTDRERAVASPMRCTLRVSPGGIYVDGDKKSRADAIKLCKKRAAAMVVLEDNVEREWTEIRAALKREHIKIYMRGQIGDVDCEANPLAKGCP